MVFFCYNVLLEYIFEMMVHTLKIDILVEYGGLLIKVRPNCISIMTAS